MLYAADHCDLIGTASVTDSNYQDIKLMNCS